MTKETFLTIVLTERILERSLKRRKKIVTNAVMT